MRMLCSHACVCVVLVSLLDSLVCCGVLPGGVMVCYCLLVIVAIACLWWSEGVI